MIDETAIGERYRALAGELDERRRRLWAAAEARVAGRGGIAAAARATGMAENTIRRGLRELETGERLEPGRVRRPGAERTPVTTADPTLLADLERLVDTQSRGDPESPLRWTATSVRRLRDELHTGGHRVSHETVARLLRGLGYSLQANRKVREGTAHPDRDAQFQHLNTTATRALDAGEPVISVDTKKKELVGDAQERRAGIAPQGLTRAGPGAGRHRPRHGPVCGQLHPRLVGAPRPGALPRRPHVGATAGCGGANGYRTRLWKVELQRLADETGLARQGCHFPPGTVPRGTRSSSGCSPSSPATGAANRSPSLRRSST